jgi:hypothetical protein
MGNGRGCRGWGESFTAGGGRGFPPLVVCVREREFKKGFVREGPFFVTSELDRRALHDGEVSGFSCHIVITDYPNAAVYPSAPLLWIGHVNN